MYLKICVRQQILPVFVRALMVLTAGTSAQVIHAEPVLSIPVKPTDSVRYGPGNSKEPGLCKGDDCAITVVEYTDYQCSYCEKGHATTQRLLKDYQGRIRWIVRDFPLPGHPRAKRAAVAAQCAKDQGQYWGMHDAIFKNQDALGEGDLRKMAQSIGLNTETFDSCMNQPEGHEKSINENIKSGQTLGVSGTPTYFVNGQRIAGALPYEEFKRVIDKTLTQK
ncbi:MAG TPA: thioredoxin domain-containing protein [Oligoflexus sp.]|uniref:DsbA family protein n=1 Tax=Oligoflexus sp. TaxID=1971216 RepID=UPI002D69F28C|nr:thioredoxin domain-containing protein [Oligoflexus sp.]HYX37703.1 thioredoxin domain-containing protein [Oligoflexus sp.]